MSRFALAVLLLLGTAPAAAAQAPPPAPTPPTPPTAPAAAPVEEKRIAPGVSVAKVDVGNLTRPEAAAKLEAALAPTLRQPVVVAVAGRRFRLTEKSSAFSFDAAKSATRAYVAGLMIPPGTGQTVDVEPYVDVRRGRIKDFAARVDRRVYLPARNARVRITVRRIKRQRAKHGRDLDAGALRARLEKVVVDPAAARLLRPGRTVVRAAVNVNDCGGSTPPCSRSIARTSSCASSSSSSTRRRTASRWGAAGYDTPTGLKSITNKAVNPAWSAPNRPWAGLYAGRTVPGGSPENPLKARWLGIADGIGIHGTGDPGSIGSRASHGCIRMTVPAVIDLYPRVPVGTPVLIK
jgi:lipoprotein-anchoring transpeptidase ErfK/SrfK